MADYISQFTGAEIDQRLAKVSQLETNKQDKLISGTNLKTINSQSLLGSGNIEIQGGGGVGFDSISSNQDGTLLITLTNGDTITVDLNHNHPQYTKCVYCASQAAYDAISPKDSDTLYLILETS